MRTFEWNVRTVVTVFITVMLTTSVGAMGLWLLLSGQPGTGMMEGADHTQMMANGEHPAMMETVIPGHMMGVPADRGVWGGYTGTIGLVMIVVFVAMVALLLYTLLSERPGQPQSSVCWNCERPIETDWTTCPYCGVELAEAGRQPSPLET